MENTSMKGDSGYHTLTFSRATGFSFSCCFVTIRFNPAMTLFQTPRKKNSFTFYFRHTSFILREVKLAELSINSFLWKKCDTLGDGVKTYSDPCYVFSGGQDPHPKIYAPAKCKQHVWIDGGGRGGNERCVYSVYK